MLVNPPPSPPASILMPSKKREKEIPHSTCVCSTRSRMACKLYRMWKSQDSKKRERKREHVIFIQYNIGECATYISFRQYLRCSKASNKCLSLLLFSLLFFSDTSCGRLSTLCMCVVKSKRFHMSFQVATHK